MPGSSGDTEIAAIDRFKKKFTKTQAEYIPSAAYTGSRPGYIFTTRNKGLGYYLDHRIEASPSKVNKPPKLFDDYMKYFIKGMRDFNSFQRKTVTLSKNTSEVERHQKKLAAMKMIDTLEKNLLIFALEKNSGRRDVDEVDRSIRDTKNEITQLRREHINAYYYF